MKLTQRMHKGSCKNGDVKRALHRLVKQSSHPARILESYYWSLEPELLQIMRYFIALPDAAKSVLYAFLRMSSDSPDSVTAVVGPKGEVTLFSPAVSEVVGLISANKDTRIESVH